MQPITQPEPGPNRADAQVMEFLTFRLGAESYGIEILKVQEIPYDDPDSRYMFQPSPQKPFVTTPAAIAMYRDAIARCLSQLQQLAVEKNGLDYLQVFEDPDKPESL